MTDAEIKEKCIEYYISIEDMKDFLGNVGTANDRMYNGGGDVSDVSRMEATATIISRITHYIGVIRDAVEFLKDYVRYTIVQWLLKQFELVSLRLKRLALTMKHAIAKLKTRILAGVASMVSSDAFATALAAVMAIIKALGESVDAILTVLQGIVNGIPPIMSVGGRHMALFMTPKSLKKQDLIPSNPGQDICNKLPESVSLEVESLYNKANELNNIQKNTVIASMSTTGLNVVENDTLKKVVDGIQLTTPQRLGLLAAIDLLVYMAVFPEALPKYEKLSLSNMSFMAWLLTGFEPAVKASFGIPGQP